MKTVFSHECGGDFDMDAAYLPEGHIWGATGLYLHGKLEHLVGYDIVYVPYPESILEIENSQERWQKRTTAIREHISEGVHDVVVKADGKEYKAKAYVYHNPERDLHALRGLIVLESDEKSVEYAKECYENRKCLL